MKIKNAHTTFSRLPHLEVENENLDGRGVGEAHPSLQPYGCLNIQLQKTTLPLGLQLTLLKLRGSCVQSVLRQPKVHLSVEDFA